MTHRVPVRGMRGDERFRMTGHRVIVAAASELVSAGMGQAPDNGYATPEEATRGDIAEQYVIVLGVRITGDEATVWMLTNDRPPFEPYEEQCIRERGRWSAMHGSNGFSIDTPPEIFEKAASLGFAF